MTDTVTPNPPSPFADADPQFRHIFPTPMFFGDPTPGALTVTGCVRLAVVPDEPMRVANPNQLPAGLCPGCVAAMRGQQVLAESRPVTGCRTCEGRTEHDGVCAVCRQEFHQRWVADGKPEGRTLEQYVSAFLTQDGGPAA